MLFFAMPGTFSLTVLHRILPHIRPKYVVVPAPRAHGTHRVTRAPALFLSTPSVVDVALQHDIPVLALADWPDVRQCLDPSAWLVAACFPRRVPAWVRQNVACALNIHPSALPAWRGPDPLFYVARGDAEPAVTVHLMEQDYDAGPIVAQQRMVAWDWHDEAELIRTHALVGAELLLQHWHGGWHAHPQAVVELAYAHEPRASDYTLQPSWSMQRVQRFVAGTQLRNHPYYVPLQRVWVDTIGCGTVPIVCNDGVCYGRARES